jgi:hypothetical protein
VTCTYNGVDLSSPEFQTLGVSSRNVFDAAERTVTHQVVTLKIKTYIIEGATQNATMAAIRTGLERPGGELVYSGTAFGGLSINTGANNRDLVWGPKPRVLEWKPVGGDRAAEITWQVEVALLNCAGAVTSGEVMEAVYSLTIATDKGGYAVKTHAGLIRIPMTRTAVDNSNVPDTADAYFEAWVPRKLEGWDRQVSRTLDESKSKLTFSVVDTERKGYPLPAGVVEATGSHTMQSTGKYVHVSWTGTISATYETERTQPRGLPWDAFLRLCADRIEQERRRNGVFIPIGMSIGEPELYGPTSSSFSLTYALNYANMARTFPTAGLWRPPPDATWRAWSDSLEDAQHPRGLSRLQHRNSEDGITDLCLGGTSRLNAGPGGRLARLHKVLTPWEEFKRRLRIDDRPPSSATWLLYDNRLIIEPIDHTVPHVPLPTETLKESRLVTPNMRKFEHDGPVFRLRTQTTPGPVVQNRATSSYYVRMIGRAVRWTYEIPRPMLTRAAGSKVAEANHPDAGTFWTHWLATWTANPIYAARWNLRWFVTRPTGAAEAELPTMPIPYQQAPLDNPEI